MNRQHSDPKLQLTRRGDEPCWLTSPLSSFFLVHPGLVLSLTNPSLQTWLTSVLLTTALSAPDKPITHHIPIKVRRSAQPLQLRCCCRFLPHWGVAVLSLQQARSMHPLNSTDHSFQNASCTCCYQAYICRSIYRSDRQHALLQLSVDTHPAHGH